MGSTPSATHFRSAALAPVVGLLVAVAQFAHEFVMPKGGPERATYLQDHPVWELHLAGAAVLSLAALLLVRGLWLDRGPLRARDDRLTSSYLGASLLTLLFSAMTGAVPGALLACGVVAGLAVLRRGAADVRGVAGSHLRAAALAAVAAGGLFLGVSESYATFAHWRFGYSISGSTVGDYAAARGADIVVPLVFGLAVVGALAVPVTIWRQRRRLAEAAGVGYAASFVVLVGLLAGARPAGVDLADLVVFFPVLAVLSAALVFVFSRSAAG
jgi:hypothetical protein